MAAGDDPQRGNAHVSDLRTVLPPHAACEARRASAAPEGVTEQEADCAESRHAEADLGHDEPDGTRQAGARQVRERAYPDCPSVKHQSDDSNGAGQEDEPHVWRQRLEAEHGRDPWLKQQQQTACEDQDDRSQGQAEHDELRGLRPRLGDRYRLLIPKTASHQNDGLIDSVAA